MTYFNHIFYIYEDIEIFDISKLIENIVKKSCN